MGGGTPRTKRILESLIAARGTAIAVGDRTSVAYVETLAVARALAAAWSTNQRLANQWDARRMTSLLERWESIFAIRSHPDASDASRRHLIELAQARVGRAALLTTISAELTDALGAKFVAVEFISVANAIITAPDGTYPYGIVVADMPWSSTVSQILIRVQATADETDFYDSVGLIADRLDSLIPAWANWTWYRAPEFGAPSDVVGGPGAGGFYLDERNLNESVFRV